MRYNVGDVVIVRDDLSRYETYGEWVAIDDMEFMRGKHATITLCLGDSYCIKEFGCYWTDEMFSGLAEPAVEVSVDVSEFL